MDAPSLTREVQGVHIRRVRTIQHNSSFSLDYQRHFLQRERRFFIYYEHPLLYSFRVVLLVRTVHLYHQVIYLISKVSRKALPRQVQPVRTQPSDMAHVRGFGNHFYLLWSHGELRNEEKQHMSPTSFNVIDFCELNCLFYFINIQEHFNETFLINLQISHSII